MIYANEGPLVLMPPSVPGSNTVGMSFDARESDYLNLYIQTGSHATAEGHTTSIAACALREHDTQTNPTSMSVITAFQAGTGFTTPATDKGCALEFQVDLKKRKRYVGLTITGDATATAAIGAIGRMTKNAVSASSTSDKSISNLNNTSSTSCARIVSG